ncbi:MAG: glutamine synthetase [Alphaproteobacteria bacterium]|nr:glutamine synthetase [Alphaproteobacteria bacterium]
MLDPKQNELDTFLKKYPDIELVHVILTDPVGIQRGKGVRPHELKAIFEQGRAFPSSIFSLTVLGEDVEEAGLLWDIGDQDCFAHPIPGTLKRTAWLEKTGQVYLAFRPDSGPAAAADPRLRLSDISERMKKDGLYPVLAIELEFYLLDKAAARDGRIVPALAPGGLYNDQVQVYSIQELDDFDPFLRELYAACDAQNLPAESVISEYAPGQMEITLTHRADALQAVDEAIQYKRLVKGVAEKHGMIACFMAKPFTANAGSGMHIHLSLNDAKGNNQFASEAAAGNDLLRHAIGGMASTINDSMAIFAPNANSYRRFRRNTYAPVAPTWGVNNRTVSFRIPAGPPKSRHVEHRICGADANPYLAAAAVLAAMHHGIKTKSDPGPATTGNGYATKVEGLTLNWFDALDAFEESKFIVDYFGADFVKIFSAVKRAECERFFAEVTDLDHRWHLRTA